VIDATLGFRAIISALATTETVIDNAIVFCMIINITGNAHIHIKFDDLRMPLQKDSAEWLMLNQNA
jgi:hypothetical protein